MYKVWIIEDDDKIASVLQEYLEKYEYSVRRAADYRHLKQEFLEAAPDLVILDINLPYYDGFYWCRQFRMISNVPIMFLSARVGGMDQVLAIENGGDDFITKPFDLDVLIAKVKGLIRRAYGEYAVPVSRDVIEVDGLCLDLAKNMLEWGEHRASLSKNETLLLAALLKKTGEIVSREDLLEALWDDVDFVDDNTLTVNVTRVRKKLEELGLPKVVETIRGRGYRLNRTWRNGQ